MITFLFFVWVFFFVTLSIKTVLRSKKEKKRRLFEQELLNQQMMLKEYVLQTMDISSVPMLANVGAEEKTKRSSIGWVVLFGILFTCLFLLAQPWIRALVILGWDDFRRMLTL